MHSVQVWSPCECDQQICANSLSASAIDFDWCKLDSSVSRMATEGLYPTGAYVFQINRYCHTAVVWPLCRLFFTHDPMHAQGVCHRLKLL